MSQDYTYISIIFGYLSFMLLLGFLAKKKHVSNSLKGYFLSDGTIGSIVGFFALGATILSSFGLLGAAGFYYQHGIGTLFFAFTCLIVPFLFSTYAFKLLRLSKERNYITLGDFMEDRYNCKTLRIITSINLICITIPYIAIQIMGFGYVISGLTSISYQSGAIILGLIMIIYIMVGGYTSVAWTNVAQGILMITSLLVAAFLVVNVTYGSLDVLFSEAKVSYAEHLKTPGPKGYWSAATWLSWLIFMFGLGVQPQVIQKFFSVKDEKALKFSLITYPIFGVIIYLCVLVIGIVGLLKFPGLSKTDSDMITMVLAREYLPIWIGGLLACGAVAAAMSTADSQYLTVSSMITKDFYSALFGKDAMSKNAVLFGRICVFILFLIGATIALLRIDSIVGILQKTVFPFGAQSFVPMIFGLYWQGANKYGAVAGTLIGLALAVYFVFINPQASLYGVPTIAIALGFNVLATVLVSILFSAKKN